MSRLQALYNAGGRKGRGAPPQVPRGPSHFQLSGIDWGQDAAEERSKPDNRWMTPTLSAYSGPLSRGRRYARPGFISVKTWKAILKEAGFTGASTAGLAVLTNSLDHQMTTIISALKEVKTRHPQKVFGISRPMIGDFLSALHSRGVTNAGQGFEDLPQTPAIWAQMGATRRVGKPISESTKARLKAQHVLPSIITKAAGFLKRLQDYMGMTPGDKLPGQRVWGNAVRAWAALKNSVGNDPDMVIRRMEEAGLIPAKWAKGLRAMGDIPGLDEFVHLLNTLAVDIRRKTDFSAEAWNQAKTQGITLCEQPGGQFIWIIFQPAMVFPTAANLPYLGYITRFLSPKDVLFFITGAQGGATNFDPKWPEMIEDVMTVKEKDTESAQKARQALVNYYRTLQATFPNMRPAAPVSPWFAEEYLGAAPQQQNLGGPALQV